MSVKESTLLVDATLYQGESSLGDGSVILRPKVKTIRLEGKNLNLIKETKLRLDILEKQ